MDFGETISFHSTPKIMELDMVSQDILDALNHHCDIENTVESGSIEFSDLLNVIQSKPIPTNTWEDPNAEQFINYLHIIKWLHNTAAHEKIFNTLLTKILTIAKPGKYPLYEEANRNF